VILLAIHKSFCYLLSYRICDNVCQAKDELNRVYEEIDTTSSTGFLTMAPLSDGTQLTSLIKESVTVHDSGSYRCAVLAGNELPYSLDVIVIEG